MHDMHNTIIPEGCFNKSQLSKALSIGTSTLQNIAKQDDFPEPEGYYQVPSCGRQYPYWNLEEVKCFLEGVTFEKPDKKTTTPGPRLENASPWAVPAYDRKESIVSIKTRKFLKLMRVEAA